MADTQELVDRLANTEFGMGVMIGAMLVVAGDSRVPPDLRVSVRDTIELVLNTVEEDA